ncbi:MAG TPA: hypothetical protein PKI11_08990 [Candidatus Hydrogenedentes bacterium]|nr:hypothetical protein [Candidatus Hydrogenedentota bacterium]HNT89352.1 hypothetical protein [Candidatus Hydrogenedentota bacterium]
MDCGDFWADVTDQVWTMAIGYWLKAFTQWITAMFNCLFGLNECGHNIVP